MIRRPITFICAYYDNPGMLREQQRVWASYPEDLKPHFHAIVTDDCSPRWPARPHVASTGIASFKLFRTQVDVRWNWLFCRNLGVSRATTDWVLLTDIDHVLPVETLAVLLTEKLDVNHVYRFSREDAPDRTPYKPHPNTWFLTRKMFDRIGGYDERFSGFYGTDADFRERVHQRAHAVVMRPEVLIRYPREVIADASTTTYGRKEPQDHENVRRIRDERAALGEWRPLRLTFPYEEVVCCP
jgi:hypothetical protein